MKSVELAREARNEFHFSPPAKRLREGKRECLLVAGSVGPYGAFLADGSEYRGDYRVPKEEMRAFHRGRIEALVEAGVDALACETMPSYAEMEAVAELLASEFPDVEAWFSFTLRDARHVSDGTSLAEVARMLDRFGNVVAVGVNCISEDVALEALEELKKSTRKPLVVYPNSGELWNAAKRGWEGSRCEGTHLAERVRGYWRVGARMIGGCCRTTPDDIEVISESLRRLVGSEEH